MADPRNGNGQGAPEGGPVGSVMVVGGGIAGIQSALDLADSGYEVFLVEKGPSIGGTMTQLDKTFPTNDCSMCIVSPKLVEASRHNNIRVLSYSEVEEVSGSAGRFKVKVRRKARSVDPGKCTGCGVCMTACPVSSRVRVPERFEDEPTREAAEVDAVIEEVGTDRRNLIHLLQEVQRRLNFLPEAALRRISLRLSIPYAEVYGTASFYKAFSLEPRGKHLMQVCMGTACHVRGAQRILEELERRLSIKAGMTTEDRVFTLETVNCLGACALGPIVAVDGEYHGNLTVARLPKLIDAYAKK